jgi:predicted aminopeptidase
VRRLADLPHTERQSALQTLAPGATPPTTH